MTRLPVDGALFLIKAGIRITPHTFAVLSGSVLCCGCDSALHFFLQISLLGLKEKNKREREAIQGSMASLTKSCLCHPQYKLLMLTAIKQFSVC